MATPVSQTNPNHALQVFFSYASQNRKFVEDLVKHTGFRRILRCKIFDYFDDPVSVSGLRRGLEKRVADSDVIVVFMSGDYARSASSVYEFDLGVTLVGDRPTNSRLRDMIFLVLDADGDAWWNGRRQQPDMKALWPDPVWLNCMNELGTAPADVTNADVTRKIDKLAEQLRDRLSEALVAVNSVRGA